MGARVVVVIVVVRFNCRGISGFGLYQLVL